MTNKNELKLIVDNIKGTKEEILSKETFQREINALLEKINNMIYSEQTLNLLKVKTEELLRKYMEANLLDDRIRFEYETINSVHGVYLSLKLLFEDKVLCLEKIEDLFNISDYFYTKEGNNIEYYKFFNKFEVSIDKSTLNKDLEYMINKAMENKEKYKYKNFWISKIKECIKEYQRLSIINKDIQISTSKIDENHKIKFYYDEDELYLEKYDEIFDFCKDEYRYIENGEISNVKDKYDPIYKVDGNKLMITGRVFKRI